MTPSHRLFRIQCLTCPLSPRTSSSAPPATSARPSRAGRIEMVQRLDFSLQVYLWRLDSPAIDASNKAEGGPWQKGSDAIPPARVDATPTPHRAPYSAAPTPCVSARRSVLALFASFRRPGTERVTPPPRLPVPVQCPAPCASESARRPRAFIQFASAPGTVRAIPPPRPCTVRVISPPRH